MNWQHTILTNSSEIANLLNETRTIAVLGIKTEAQAGQPAFYVPSYLQTAGFQIVPVPVYYPNTTRILGQQVYRQLIDIPIDVDLVNVFRRSQDVPPHVEDGIVRLTADVIDSFPAAYFKDAHFRFSLPSSSLPYRDHQSLRLVIFSLRLELP